MSDAETARRRVVQRRIGGAEMALPRLLRWLAIPPPNFLFRYIRVNFATLEIGLHYAVFNLLTCLCVAVVIFNMWPQSVTSSVDHRYIFEVL